jgi:hypothetical protein
MTQSVQSVEQDDLPVGTVASLKPPKPLLSALTTKFCSSNDSDASLSIFSTASSCPAATSRSRVNSHCTHTSTDKVRERYYHRLGIHAIPSAQLDSQHQRAFTASPTFPSSWSAPEKKMGFYVDKVKHDSLRQSSSQGDIPTSTAASRGGYGRHDEIILLRRSVQYTTKLKLDPNGENANGKAPRSSLSKFELSSAWTSLLSNDPASTLSSSSEHVDGAFDLFSLPSEASIASSRCDSAKSVDTTIALEGLPSRDDLSLSSIPKQRKVSFDSTVKTATIPSRHSYSNRIKSRIWSSTEEIYANGFRNVKEFEYDGKNWRTAKEECEFLRCASANELLLVHPVHFSGRLSAVSNMDSAVSSGPKEQEEEEEEVHDELDGMFDMD